MNVRTAIGLCALAALLGGAFAGVTLTGSPKNASASAPYDDPHGPEEAPYATYHYECHVDIRHAHVEGSNICSPGAKADAREWTTGGNGSTPGASGHGRRGSQDCDADGLVTLQACHVTRDVNVVKDVDVTVKHVVERVSTEDTVEDIVEGNVVKTKLGDVLG